MPGERWFTIEEANALIPRLSMWIGRLQQGALRLGAQMEALARAQGVSAHALTTADLLRSEPEARIVIEELDALVGEIEASGAELKDLQLGLVDFPTERAGETVALCWQFGEPEVAYWHDLHEGFPGRKLLPRSAGALPLLQ